MYISKHGDVTMLEQYIYYNIETKRCLVLSTVESTCKERMTENILILIINH